MNERPLIMLDVDGVLNPFCSRPPEGHGIFPIGMERVLLNPSHGPMVLDLAKETGADLVWCTMWQTAANTFISPRLGLPQLPVVGIPPISEIPWGVSIGAHKAMYAARYAGSRPLVWFDDEPDAAYWMYHMAKGPALVVQINSDQGITKQHFDVAKAWLLTHGREAA